jgi:transposase
MRHARIAPGEALSGHDRRRVGAALERVRDVRAYRRLWAVLLVCRGHGISEAARLTGQTRQSVHNAVRRYSARRCPEDLRDAPRPGRPRVAGRVTDRRIVREYERDPLSLGYMATEWTVPLLARHLSERYGCRVTRRTLRRRLKAVGLTWKRPRHVFSEKAPHVGQKKGRSSAA